MSLKGDELDALGVVDIRAATSPLLLGDEHVDSAGIAGVVGLLVENQVNGGRFGDRHFTDRKDRSIASDQATRLKNGVTLIQRPGNAITATVMNATYSPENVDLAHHRTGPANDRLAVLAWVKCHITSGNGKAAICRVGVRFQVNRHMCSRCLIHPTCSREIAA